MLCILIPQPPFISDRYEYDDQISVKVWMKYFRIIYVTIQILAINYLILQARAIHELSKKVFHALKTDPKNFESEFSETRRRNVRRVQSEARSPIYSSSPKHNTNLRSNSTAVNDSSKIVSNLLSGSTNLKRSSRGNTWCSSAATPFSERDPEMLPGKK